MTIHNQAPRDWLDEARNLRNQGWKLAAIAQKFGVTVSGISQALKRQSEKQRHAGTISGNEIVTAYFDSPAANPERLAQILKIEVDQVMAVLTRRGLPYRMKEWRRNV